MVFVLVLSCVEFSLRNIIAGRIQGTEGLDLNSPEFLQRKAEILSKELAETQQKLAALEVCTVSRALAWHTFWKDSWEYIAGILYLV
jgi:hypothetical protein